MRDLAIKFFSEQSQDARTVKNERGLQLELGLMFRSRGFDVRFEVSCAVPSHARQTKRQKRNIDLLVTDGTIHLVIELKVPLSGRVPETMYDFFADVAFVEAVVGSGMADEGLCILLTSDQHFGRVERLTVSMVHCACKGVRSRENTRSRLASATQPSLSHRNTTFHGLT